MGIHENVAESYIFMLKNNQSLNPIPAKYVKNFSQSWKSMDAPKIYLFSQLNEKND